MLTISGAQQILVSRDTRALVPEDGSTPMRTSSVCYTALDPNLTASKYIDGKLITVTSTPGLPPPFGRATFLRSEWTSEHMSRYYMCIQDSEHMSNRPKQDRLLPTKILHLHELELHPKRVSLTQSGDILLT